MHTSDRGGRDWDGRDTNSLAADAASVMSKASKELKESKVAEEKSKMQQKYLNVTSYDLWCIRDKLSGKRKVVWARRARQIM